MIPETIILYHSRKNKMPLKETEMLFSNLAHFLIEASKGKSISPNKEVDKAWHTFILHTRQYQDYCLENFGAFIHHNPFLVESDADCDAGDDMRISPNALASCENEGGKKCDAVLSTETVFADCGSGKCDSQFKPTTL